MRGATAIFLTHIGEGKGIMPTPYQILSTLWLKGDK
jgi:hypothetical protein